MRLLHRTILSYLTYSIIVLLIVVPIFYFVINTIFIREVDETLAVQKKEIQIRIKGIKSEDDLRTWIDLDGNMSIEPLSGKVQRDSIYYINSYDSLTQEEEPYRVLSTVIEINGKPYRLTTRISLLESEDLIRALATTQAAALLVLLIGLLFINWRLSKKIWKPFYDTLEKLKKFEMEKSNQLNLKKSNVKEFEDLNAAIKQLTERDFKAYLSQKEFTENAAHEMQTPLAVFQTKLELLMQTRPTEEQAKLMESLSEATTRLARLNRALLLLSKIDSEQFIETEQVPLLDLTVKLTELFRHEMEAKGIPFQIENRSNPWVRINPVLMEILLSNLITNAIRHNPFNGNILIDVSEHAWEISNPGSPLQILPQRIFDRFQKGAGTAGTGLGLAIAKKITDKNGLALDYQYFKGTHLFSIRF